MLRNPRNLVFSAILLLSLPLVSPASAPAEEAGKNEVFINHGSIVLMENDAITKFITPKLLMEHGRFEVRIKRPKAEAAPEALPAATLSERIEARRIMHDANQAYFAGDIAKSWELVTQAEQLDPTFYRIKTMKGSLLYKIGSVDLALEVWQESLLQNPNQPEIVQTLQAIKSRSAGAGSTVAAGADVNAKKKASLQ